MADVPSSQAQVDALFDNPAPDPATPATPADQANQAAVDALFADHPALPAVVSPPQPAPAPAPSAPGLPPAPGPQDSDGIFTTPKPWNGGSGSPDTSDDNPGAALGGFMGQTWHALKDAASGSGKVEFPDYPELSQIPTDQRTLGQSAQLGFGQMFSSDPKQMSDIALKALPGSTASTDKFGNPMITYNDQTYYVAKPGFSNANISQAAGTAIPALAVASGVGAIPALAGTGIVPTVVRSVAQGVGQAGVSAARDVGADVLGSDQGISKARAEVAGALGAAAEPVAAVASAIGSAATSAWRSMFGFGGDLLNDAGKAAAATNTVTSDMLTKTGQMVLDKAGADPSSMTVGQMQAAEAALGKRGAAAIGYATDPNAAAITARNTLLSAKTGVPLTTGQTTGDPWQLYLEDQLRQRQGTAQPIMKGFSYPQPDGLPVTAPNQPAAVQQAATNLVPGLAPAEDVPSVAAQGQTIRDQIQARAAQLSANTTAAYQQPGMANLTNVGHATAPTGESLYLSGGVSQNILQGMQDLTRTRAAYSPAVQDAQATVAKLITAPSADMAPGVEGVAAMNSPQPNPHLQVQVAPFNVGAADEAMRKLGSIRASAASDQDKGTIGQIMATLQGGIENAAGEDLMSGNPDILDNWVNAKAAARTEFNFLGPNSPAAQTFMDGITSGELSGQQVVSGLYGMGKLGSGGTQQILNHLQTQFAPDSPEWQAIQQAGIRHVLFGPETTPTSMYPANIAGRINSALTGKGAEISQQLFPPEFIQGAQNLADTMPVLQQSQKQNPSGTAYTIGNMLNKFGKNLPLVGRVFGDEATAVKQATAAVSPGISGPLRRPTDVPLSQVRRLAPAVAGLPAADNANLSLQGVPAVYVRGPLEAAIAAGRGVGALRDAARRLNPF